MRISRTPYKVISLQDQDANDVASQHTASGLAFPKGHQDSGMAHEPMETIAPHVGVPNPGSVARTLCRAANAAVAKALHLFSPSSCRKERLDLTSSFKHRTAMH